MTLGNKRYISKASLAVAAVFALQACGGGGGGGGGSASTSTATAEAPLVVSGYVASGYAMTNATVQVLCTKGTSVTALTNSTGAYSVSVAGGQQPCVARASGDDASSVPEVYYGMSNGSSTTAATLQITPITDAIMRTLATKLGYQGGIATSMDSMWSAALTSTLSINVNISAYQEAARVQFAPSAMAGGLDISSLNFMSGPLVPAIYPADKYSGNLYDQLIERANQSGLNWSRIADAITLNLDSSKALVAGAWDNGTGGVYIFQPSAKFWFLDGEAEADLLTSTPSKPGLEYNFFQWRDGASFTVPMGAVANTNQQRGLIPLAQKTDLTYSVTVNSATLSLGGNVLSRVSSSLNPLVGAWAAEDVGPSHSTIVLVFTAGGSYYLGQDGIQPTCSPNGLAVTILGNVVQTEYGMEKGTYTWNVATSDFTSSTSIDTNGTWGLSNLPAGVATKVVVDSDVMTFTASSPFVSSPYADAAGLYCGTSTGSAAAGYPVKFVRIK